VLGGRGQARAPIAVEADQAEPGPIAAPNTASVSWDAGGFQKKEHAGEGDSEGDGGDVSAQVPHLRQARLAALTSGLRGI
jgi:hypothetical protein